MTITIRASEYDAPCLHCGAARDPGHTLTITSGDTVAATRICDGCLRGLRDQIEALMGEPDLRPALRETLRRAKRQRRLRGADVTELPEIASAESVQNGD